MKNTFGNHITITLFGESHGESVGAVIDGMPSGVKIDYELMADMMDQRRAAGAVSTARREDDLPEILSGVKDGYSEGTPIALLIHNKNVHSSDYAELINTPRPGHADYTGHIKYRGYEDASGGGHFSGRLTAPIVAAGAICMHMLNTKGIAVGTHIAKLKDIEDIPFDEDHLKEDIELLRQRKFPALDEKRGEAMIASILACREDQDSIGGILDTAVIGLQAGVGEPEFDSLESVLSHAMFSIPAVKGIEFGEGFHFADLYGSQANDAFGIHDGRIVTKTNHNGGINGGISNGMPIRFRTVVKPTPSIAKQQDTVDYASMQEKTLSITGRHDPAVIHRARVVVDALTAIVLTDFLLERYGSVYFGDER